MGFNVSYKGAMFFIGITVILFAKSESAKKHNPYHEKEDLYSLLYNSFTPDNDAPIKTATKFGTKSVLSHLLRSEELLNIPQESSGYLYTDFKAPNSAKLQPVSEECPPLRRGTSTRHLFNILSPEIVSQADPFRYLIDKTMEIRFDKISAVSFELNNFLKYSRPPQCYIPYAKALSSLLLCWPKLYLTTHFIITIRKTSPPKDTDFSFLPADISSSTSPELLDLFSSDIFDDQKPPLRLLYKLLDMPKNNILNLEAQLKKFGKWWKKTFIYSNRDHRCYFYFSDAVWNFLQDQSSLEKLKENVALIRSSTTSDQLLLPATPINSSAGYVQDEIISNQ